MTVNEAIEVLIPFRDCMYDQHGCPISDAAIALDVAIDALKRTQWISVEERLPEANKQVLLHITQECQYYDDNGDVYFTDDYFMCEGHRRTGKHKGWYKAIAPDISQYIHGEITHWMPLPEQPEEETDG